MSLPKPETLDERIDKGAAWPDWARLIRGHPTFLKSLLELLPPSQNQVDALRRTHMIAWWAKQHGDQLTQAVCAQQNEERSYIIGVHFADNPYGSQKGAAGVGLMYIDPLLVEQPITWEMVDEELLRDELGRAVDASRIIYASDHDRPDEKWLARMVAAEKAWFATAEDAPVVVVEWRQEDPDARDSGQRQVDRWDATEELLGMDGRGRQMIQGHRKDLHQFPPGLGKPRQAMMTHMGQPYSLHLSIHAPSPALMAWRRACVIDEATLMPEQSSKATRRL